MPPLKPISSKRIIGIDEVGRGSLAGPVAVAAVFLKKDFIADKAKLGTLKDSKKLTCGQREKWFSYFKNCPAVEYRVAKVYPRKIEKINISASANLAALRAYRRLVSCVMCHAPRVYLDGGLYLGNGDKRIPAKTIIKGDEKITAIKIASIIAKVRRDRLMVKLAKKYPRYGFEINKGYGTKSHLSMIKKYGPSEIHRRTFLRFS
jgi:ribonuclease HII